MKFFHQLPRLQGSSIKLMRARSFRSLMGFQVFRGFMDFWCACRSAPLCAALPSFSPLFMKNCSRNGEAKNLFSIYSLYSKHQWWKLMQNAPFASKFHKISSLYGAFHRQIQPKYGYFPAGDEAFLHPFMKKGSHNGETKNYFSIYSSYQKH